MAKRDFRTSQRDLGEARYPTLDDFDSDRRRFLGRLGAVFGAGMLGSALAACGSERRVQTHPDAGGPTQPTGPELAGGAPMPPAPADGGVPDAHPVLDAHPGPDAEWPVPGEAPAPDARIDPVDGGSPDMEWPLGGDAPEPDARVDPAPDWGMAGGMQAPDAGVDEPDMKPSPDSMPMAGVAPAPDAAIDDGGASCPNP